VPVVTIDGQKVTVRKEQTILDAAFKAGIWIPTLCYHAALETSASCRICMVEIEKKGGKQLVTACNYPVREDLTVLVNSDAAIKARKGVMQLLLARSPESEDLKKMAERMGVFQTPYPKVTESQRSCILCGLCVTVCEQVIGCSAIGFTGRGSERVVGTPFRMAAEDCIACGACAAVCPVGTIQIRIHAEEGEMEISPFKSRVKLQHCGECGARMLTLPVNKRMLEDVDINWDEFRQRVQLCPDCRRKITAQGLGLADVQPVVQRTEKAGL
jgi:bidirectional [NiFe] hydrogenase diaphorase subunit